MAQKLKCWEFFECSERQCPVYESNELRCWLISGTHCRKEIQGKFLEKIETCLHCEPFKANVDVSSMEETLKVVDRQFTTFKEMVNERDRELEDTSLELAMGLSEVFEALKKISSGDPSVRLPQTSKLELVTKLKHIVNATAEELGEIVDLSHEFAICLAEHFGVLDRVSKGDLSARVSGASQVELLESLKKVTNRMVDNIAHEITEHGRTSKKLQKRTSDLSERVKELDCLYSISELVARPDISLDELLQEIVDVIPDSLQYPETTCARIVIGGHDFRTNNFSDSHWKQSADIIVDGEKAGAWEICYLEQRPEADEGPFLKWERRLINAVAEQTGRIIERKSVEGQTKKLERQFQQAQKMEAVGRLASGVAHDFNNLLSIIQGNVFLMLFDVDENQPHHENLKTIERQIKRGSRLTRQLLGYARKGKYKAKPVSLNQLVEEIAETFGRTRKQITVHRELAEDLFAIEADEGQIEQVLLNLCVNAADAMPDGGDLFFKTENTTNSNASEGKVYDAQPGNYVLLTVTDTGEGMDEETQKRVFDPFFTTKEMGRGTGLGLASVYGIIKGHKGYIDVESTKGRGTTFSIYLRASEKKAGETVETAAEIIEGSETILLVDDEPIVLEVGAKVLEKLGYTVLDARGGEEAIEIYQANKNKAELVILDLVMPGMGGDKVYDRLKEINPDVKVLLASGYSLDQQIIKILDRGCDGFIQKPFTEKHLSQSIRKILDVEHREEGQGHIVDP